MKNITSNNQVEESFFQKFKEEALSVLRKSIWFAVPLLLLLLLVRVNVLDHYINDAILMITGVVLMVLGLPLSAALRVDELSIELGNTLPREVILMLALLIAVVNITIILSVRKALIKPKVAKNTNNER